MVMSIIWWNLNPVGHKARPPTRSPVRLRNVLVIGVGRVFVVVVSDLVSGASELNIARTALECVTGREMDISVRSLREKFESDIRDSSGCRRHVM